MVTKLKEKIALRKLLLLCYKLYIGVLGEKRWEIYRFKKLTGNIPNLENPHKLNEKIAWLKINYFQDFFVKCCDKYLLHDYLTEKLGKDYAPKLIFVTQTPKELNFQNITEFPCIIKVSNGSGANLIVRSKGQYSEEYLQNYFALQVVNSNMHAILSLEHQYDIKKPYIVVEELLKDEKGNIPNDYKFLYINGVLEFVYCSVDRMGANVRHVYDSEWKRLHFAWVAGADADTFSKYDNSPNIAPPKFFKQMKMLSYEIAQDFPLVRVDFYETDNRIYVGEITLHHGSGHDVFYPESYDELYGKKLNLPIKNR